MSRKIKFDRSISSHEDSNFDVTIYSFATEQENEVEETRILK